MFSKKTPDMMALIDELSKSLNSCSDVEFEKGTISKDMKPEEHALAIQFYFIRKFKRSVQ